MPEKVTAKSLAVAVAEVLKIQKRLPISQIAAGAGISEDKARSLLFEAMREPTWAVVTFEYPPLNGTVVTGLTIRNP